MLRSRDSNLAPDYPRIVQSDFTRTDDDWNNRPLRRNKLVMSR